MTDTAQPPATNDRLDALRALVTEAVRGSLPAGYRALLFGSRATGAAGLKSDWDIGIVGPAPLDGAIVERIREALDSVPTLSTFEVVDLSTVPAGFRDRALREGIALELART